MDFTVIIPARYASTRLAGKVLLDIAGKTIVQRVYERACESAAQRVIIATDDSRVEAEARRFGADVVMTAETHESGTDRLQEVVQLIALGDDELVVNVQGDEPLIPPAVIDQVAHNLAHNRDAGISTLCEPIMSLDQVFDPNAVKVVFDKNGYALYFSRAPIPYCREWTSAALAGAGDEAKGEAKTAMPEAVSYYRHIGIYGYRVGFLNQFVNWPMSPLEATEKLEQLRAMSNGVRIHVEVNNTEIPPGIDTREDLDRVRALFAEDSSA